MKTMAIVSALSLLLLAVAPSTCFALWRIANVTKARAKDLGMEIRVKPDGPNKMRVELAFKVEGSLKDFSRVDMQGGGETKTLEVATLRENLQKPGRALVSFVVETRNLDQVTLRIMIPSQSGHGGVAYELRMGELVDLKRA
jgi:hypothetical protein